MTRMALLCLLGFLASTNVWSQTSETKEKVPQNWKTLDETTYIIHYPDSFYLDRSGQMGSSFVLLSQQTSEKDRFRENINLMIQDISSLGELDQYVEVSLAQITAIAGKENLIESKRMKSGDSEFHKVIFSAPHGQFHLKFEQYYWVKDNKAYALTFTSEVDQFENYRKAGEAILNSFRLK